MKKLSKMLCSLLILALSISLLSGCSSKDTTDNNKDAINSGGNAEGDASEEPDTEGSKNEAGTTPRNETLYFNGQQWGAINDWNPMSSNSNNAMGISQTDCARVLIYETLFMYNILDGTMQPLLASDYAWNDKQTVLTIHMNADAKWSDGTPVTAEDAAYTYNTHVKYSSATGSNYGAYIDSMTAENDTTLIIKSKLNDEGMSINPLKLLEYLPKVYVMQKAYLQTLEDKNGEDLEKMKTDTMEDFISTGPYKKFFNNDQKVVFQRDDNYWGQSPSMWGKLPAPKYIAHNVFADNAAGDTAFSQGEVDVSQQFISEVWKLWEEAGKPISTYIDEEPYQLCATMPSAYFNLRVKGLDRKEVRKAIAMAVDYDQIISTAMSKQSPTFTQVPRSLMNPTDAEQKLVDHSALKDYAFTGNDISGANQLLDDAGIIDTDGDGIREADETKLSFKVECPEGWSDWNAALENVAAAGKEIGIELETYFPATNTYLDDLYGRNFDIAMASPPSASISNPWTRCNSLLSFIAI